MKILADEELLTLFKNKKVNKRKETSKKSTHPYIQHMKKLESLIQILGADKNTDKLQQHIFAIINSLHNDNERLIREITTSQKKFIELIAFAVDHTAEKWIAKVDQRDRFGLIVEVSFEKVEPKTV